MTSTLSPLSYDCITARDFAFHPVYRTSQIYQLVILIFSVFPLVYFIFFKLLKSNFHGNLKWTLTGYFGSVLIFTIAFQLMGVFHVVLPFMAKDPCDLLINTNYLRLGHPLGSFLMTLSIIFPVSISIERFVAMKRAKNYEKTNVLLGPVLVFQIIIINAFIIFSFYKDESFDFGEISFVVFPDAVAGKMFAYFLVILLLNIINFVFNLFLLKENSRLKRMNSTLATKYQLEEVYISTKFVVSVIFVHVSFFASYLFLMISSQIILKTFLNAADMWAVTGALMTMIATYNFAIGIFSVYLYNRVRAKKTLEFNGNIQMKSTGSAGALNYDNAIFTIWNTSSSRFAKRNTI